MGKPGPQPRSMTLLPGGSVLAHFRTSFTPIPIDRVLLLPRRERNSRETASYPLDRSIRVEYTECFRSVQLTHNLHSKHSRARRKPAALKHDSVRFTPPHAYCFGSPCNLTSRPGLTLIALACAEAGCRVVHTLD